MRILVLSEFCIPLIFHVPLNATVEHIKVGFPCSTGTAPISCLATTGTMVTNDKTTVDT